MLDGLFNVSFFVTGLLTLKVVSLLKRKDNQKFHFGYSYHEPLINGIKGVLILGVSLMAFVGSISALLEGGSIVEPGPAIIYGVVATASCLGLAILTRKTARKTGSPLLDADSKSWMINSVISSAVLFTFITIFLIRGTSLDSLVPYIDPILVIIIVLISISVPIKMSYQALMELLDRAPSDSIVSGIREIIEQQTSNISKEKIYLRVVQPGRSRYVLTHVILSNDQKAHRISMFDTIRKNTLTELEKVHQPVILDMIFTSDESTCTMEYTDNQS